MRIICFLIVINIYGFAKVYDLISIYNLAYVNSDSYKIATLEKESSDKDIDKSLSTFYPQVKIETEFMKLNEYPVIVDGIEKYQRTNRRDITFTVDQVIYDRSKYLDYKDKKNLFNQKTLEKVKAKQQLIFDVTKYYFEALYKAKQIELITQKLKRLEKIEQRALFKYKSGFISKADYLEAKSEKDELITQKLQYELNYKTSRSFLEKFTGINDLDVRKKIVLDDINIDDILEGFQNFQNNLDFKIQEYKVKRSDINSSIAIASFEPKLTLNYEHVQNDIEASENQHTLTLLLSMDIFNGFYNLKNYQQARIKKNIELSALKKLTKDIKQNINNKVKKIKTYYEIISSYPDILKTRRFLLDGMREKFIIGNKSIIDLLDEEDKYFEKLNKYTEYKYDFVIEYMTLMQYTSKLDDKFIKKVNGFIYE